MNQENVQRFFSKFELLICKDYWNFVCNDEHRFEIVFDPYKISSQYIKDSLTRIRNKYRCEIQVLACIFFYQKKSATVRQDNHTPASLY